MKIILEDKITGVQTKRSPFGTFGPGNMLDDSSRNSWVSSYTDDEVIVDCTSQVSSVFLGRIRADSASFTFCQNPLTATSWQFTNAGTDTTVEITYPSNPNISSTTRNPLGKIDGGKQINVNSDTLVGLNAEASDITVSTTTDQGGNIVYKATYTPDGYLDNHVFFRKDTQTDPASYWAYIYIQDHGIASTPIQDNSGNNIQLKGILKCTEGRGILGSRTERFNSGVCDITYVDANMLKLSISEAQYNVLIDDTSVTDLNRFVSYQNSLHLVQGVSSDNHSLTARTVSTITDSLANATKHFGKNAITARYVDSLADFTRGIFVQASNSFVPLSYTETRGRFQIKLKTHENQNSAIIKRFFMEEVLLTGTEYTVNSMAREKGYMVLHIDSNNGTKPYDWLVNDCVKVSGATDVTYAVAAGVPEAEQGAVHKGSSINGFYTIHSITEVEDTNIGVHPNAVVSANDRGWTVVLKDMETTDKLRSSPTILSGTTGSLPLLKIQKVEEVSGRFTALPYSGVAISYNGSLGEATLTFSAPHGLVNNDKIIIYGSNVNGLDGTYLITYYSKKEIKISIPSFKTSSISSISKNNSTNAVTVSFSAVHTFSIGDIITISGATDSGSASSVSTYNNLSFTVVSVPNTKSLTFNATNSNQLIATGGTASSGVSGSGTASNANVVVPTNLDQKIYDKVMVGGFVGMERDAEGNFIEQSLNTSNVVQIKRIKGDGTTSKNITLSGGLFNSSGLTDINQAYNVYSIMLPITSGILNAGYAVSFPNPKAGLQEGRQDYSVKKELPTGSYYYLNRVAGKTYQGTITSSNITLLEDFMAFAEEFLGKPFPVLLLEDMNMDAKSSIYAYMPQMPTMSFDTRLGNVRSVSFQFKEVL